VVNRLATIHLRKRGLFAYVISRQRLAEIYVPFIDVTDALIRPSVDAV